MTMNEQELRQMNEDIGDLLAALGSAIHYLEDGHAPSLNRIRPLRETYKQIADRCLDRRFAPSSPWISVADRLPDITESYPDRSAPILTRDKHGRVTVAYIQRFDFGLAWIEDCNGGYPIDAIVDWMPLP
jgi:hypothetical protein